MHSQKKLIKKDMPETTVYQTNVMRADASHKGMGILGDRNYDNIDGLVTNEPGLCQFYICIRQGD